MEDRSQTRQVQEPGSEQLRPVSLDEPPQPLPFDGALHALEDREPQRLAVLDPQDQVGIRNSLEGGLQFVVRQPVGTVGEIEDGVN